MSQKVPYRIAGFVMEISPTSGVLFSSYLGGQQRDGFTLGFGSTATAIAFDRFGNAYVAGATDEPDFPTTPGAFLSARGGGHLGATLLTYSYLMKISAAGKLIYSTALTTGIPYCTNSECLTSAGSRGASVADLFVDATGAATVAGQTSGVYKGNSINEGAYLLRVAPDGSSLLWSKSSVVNYGLVTSLFIAPDLRPNPQGAPVITGNVNLFGT